MRKCLTPPNDPTHRQLGPRRPRGLRPAAPRPRHRPACQSRWRSRRPSPRRRRRSSRCTRTTPMTSAPWSDLGGGLNKANLGTIWGGPVLGWAPSRRRSGGRRSGGSPRSGPKWASITFCCFVVVFMRCFDIRRHRRLFVLHPTPLMPSSVPHSTPSRFRLSPRRRRAPCKRTS